MRIGLKSFVCGTGLVLGLALTPAIQARPPRAKAPPKSGAHQMEIYEGGRLTVRYFPINLTPAESASLRDLERAQNAVAYAANLMELKRQFTADELRLEGARRRAQEWLYGESATAPLIGTGFGTLGYARPFGLRFGLDGFGGFAGLGGFPFGLGGFGGYGLGGGIASRAFAFGAADAGGGLHDALAQVIARDSTEQYAAAAERDLDRAVASVGSSRTLRVALNLPESKRGEGYGRIRPVEGALAPVVVTLKDGTQILGTKLDERNKDWIIIHTRDGSERVRISEVTRIQDNTGVRPAGG